MSCPKLNPCQLIPAHSTALVVPLVDGEPFLEISEIFGNTIQGEGVYTGHPAVFMRLQHCSLNCRWCDTTDVWRFGNKYGLVYLLELFDQSGIVRNLKNGHHLVITGGSPLLQQTTLITFLELFRITFGFLPFVEVENECTIVPDPKFAEMVSCWNNSPKLHNSGNLAIVRYQPAILQQLSSLPNSWFKFVIDPNEAEPMQEILEDYINKGLIRKEQVLLMPLAATRVELLKNTAGTLAIAIKHGVMYSTRMHIEIWDKRTGV